MARFQLKKDGKKGILIVLCLIYLLYIFGRGYIEIRNKRAQISQVEERIKEAEKKQDELRTERSSLLNEEYIEILAREELGLIKKGEILIKPIFEED